MDDVGPACHYVSMTDIIRRYLELESNFTMVNASDTNHAGVDYEYGAGGGTVADFQMHTVLMSASDAGSSITGSSIFASEYNHLNVHNNIDRGLTAPPNSSLSGSPTWFRFVIPIICAVGIAGNLLSIAVLTRRRLLSTMQRLERSVTHGLTALAVSDLLFCVAVLPQGGFFDVEDDDDGGGASLSSSSSPMVLIYRIYGVAIVNLLLMQSTWLVTMMAACRYLVVVYPLHARHQLTSRATIASISAVVIVSAIVTAPHFVGNAVSRCWTIDWQTGRHLWRYEIVSTPLHDSATFYVRWVWPICSTFVPLSFLGAFNVRLVRELNAARRSTSSVSRGLGRAVIPMTMISMKTESSGYSLNKQHQSRKGALTAGSPLRLPCKSDDGLTVTRSTSAGRKVTLTLVVIILMNLGLVTPSEILKYAIPDVQPDSNDHSIPIGHVIADVANAMQALNFAVNFFLYCVLNPHFRSTVTRMFQCHSHLTCCHTYSFDVDGRGRVASFRSGTSTVAAAVAAAAGRGRPFRRGRPALETRFSAAEVELVMDDTSCDCQSATPSQPVILQT